MGVKHFYFWYSRQFQQCLTKSVPPGKMDMLCLDMNGLFHQSAQKVFKYGTHATVTEPLPVTSLLGRHIQHASPRMTMSRKMELFRDITEKMNQLVSLVQPRSHLVLCVDGVAGLGKMNQQRQRRFRSVWNSTEQRMKSDFLRDNEFHSNLITPGTEFMDELTKYIDWYIRMMQQYHPSWKRLDIVFSNEKVAGEGEHKIMNYIRTFAKSKHEVCIYGLDADLVMLAMMLPCEHVFILREAQEGSPEWIDIAKFKVCIQNMMKWDTSHSQDKKFLTHTAISDFVILCFLVGNDFLPTIPSLAIIDGAVDLMMQVYKNVGQRMGHFTFYSHVHQQWKLKKDALAVFFEELGNQECPLVMKKYEDMRSFTPDPLILDCFSAHGLDWTTYQSKYYTKHFPLEEKQTIVQKYLDGMVWVLNYYTKGMPDWTWYFPYLYGPFASDFVQVLQRYQNPVFHLHEPVSPYVQLLMVLPPCHCTCLPPPFHRLMNDPKSPLKYAFPSSLTLDMAGKRKDWEAIVCLPPLKLSDFVDQYTYLTRRLTLSEQKRNRPGKNFLYRYDPCYNRHFMSSFGHLKNSSCRVEPIVF